MVLGVVISATLAFAITLIAIPLMTARYREAGVVDRSGSDHLKIHEGMVPLSGGPALAVGIPVSLLMYVLIYPAGRAFVCSVVTAAIVVFLIGFADDRSPQKPAIRLAVQCAAGIVMYGFGIRADIIPTWWIALPLTLFYGVGGINSINLLDGLDGMAGGVSAVSAIFLMGISIVKGDIQNAVLFAVIFGAVLAFLMFNRPPARIFLGDSGAYLLGLLMAAGIMRLMEPFSLKWFLAPLLAFAVPIVDTKWAIIRRVMTKKAFSEGDREHIYDMLYTRGWRVKRILTLFYSVATLGGIMGMFFSII